MCFFQWGREILAKHVDFRWDPQGTQGMWCCSVLLFGSQFLNMRGFCSQLEVLDELADVV
jgi:hypothetical protein